MNAFVALDFETANSSFASPCSIGMVKIIDNMMVEEFYTLINPKTHFSPSNIAIHHIKPSDVTSAPTFNEVWPHMLDFIGDLPVVAHNAQFDMNVIYLTLKKNNIEIPTMKYFCTRIMARKTISTYSYSLKNLMNYYHIDFHGHHHALNDAKACAMIAVRLLKSYESLDDYLKHNKKYLSTMKNNTTQTRNKYIRDLMQIQPETNANPDHPFYQKKIGISGTLHLPRKKIVQYIVNQGGTYIEDVNDPIDYFIHGKQKEDKPSKKEGIIRNKIALGSDITLINEEKLKAMLMFFN